MGGGGWSPTRFWTLLNSAIEFQCVSKNMRGNNESKSKLFIKCKAWPVNGHYETIFLLSQCAYDFIFVIKITNFFFFWCFGKHRVPHSA